VIARKADGYITAETAVALPALVLVVSALLWAIVVVTAQLRCVDGARAGARTLARGEPAAAGRSAALTVAPRGAAVAIDRSGEMVRVHVRATMSPPGPLLSRLPGVRVSADAVAATEDFDGG
jgi:hypothetical protein